MNLKYFKCFIEKIVSICKCYLPYFLVKYECRKKDIDPEKRALCKESEIF